MLLITVKPRELAEQIGLDWWVAKKLYDDGWLSFDPDATEITDEGMYDEFTFLGSLVTAGVDPYLLEKLLKDLERPYQYSISQMSYNWVERKWCAEPSPEEVVDQLLADCVRDNDAETLFGLQRNVQNALLEIGELEDDDAKEDEEEDGDAV